ncbi:hypothetical protein RF11_00972 [Thelohanellus kitauei]|uniref:Uncharacterized protein n=1 Tax=Thelohanellus kitauei TaxID=669202 RepID=A0A0C2N5Z2_THEKT|nr:hypothetical protein RF11_00972 [Thelohanellus kitauei]
MKLMEYRKNDITKLAIFISGVYKDINITDEFVELTQMKDKTTADNVYQTKVGHRWYTTNDRKESYGCNIIERKVITTKLETEFMRFPIALYIKNPRAGKSRRLKTMSVVEKSANITRAKGLKKPKI